MTNYFSTTESRQDRQLMFAVGVAVILHVVLLWFMSQAISLRKPDSGVVSRPIVLVSIMGPVPSSSLSPLAMPDEKPLVQRARAAKKGVHAAPTTMLPAPEKTTPDRSLTGTQTDTRAGSSGQPREDNSAPVAQEQGNLVDDSLLIRPSYLDRRPRQKSYAELANEQLNSGERRDALAEGIKNSAIPDCMTDNQGGGLLALPIAIYKATTGKCNYR